MADLAVGFRCGRCGGNLLMATCHHFRGTGHEWVLMSACMICRAVHWTADGCHDCKDAEDGCDCPPNPSGDHTEACKEAEADAIVFPPDVPRREDSDAPREGDADG